MAQTLCYMSWAWVGAPQMPVGDVYSSLGAEALLWGAVIPRDREHKGSKYAKTHDRNKQEREKWQMGSDTDLSQNLRFSACDKSAEHSDVHNHTEQREIPAAPSLPPHHFPPVFLL